MCAIFGFIARHDARPKLSTLSRIVQANIVRGPHAFGFSWIDAAGRLKMFKQTGRATDHTALFALARDARMLVGHLRFATHGSAANNLNNHPHPADGGWIVHNGIVHNYAELVRRRRLFPVTECDTEALGLLLERAAGPLTHRVASAVDDSDGPLALLGLWARPATLIVARRGNPLHFASTDEGIYFATLAEGLPAATRSMRDNRVWRFTRRNGKILTSGPMQLAKPTASLPRYQQSLLYCGG